MSIGDMIQLLPHSQIEVLKACSHLVLVGYTLRCTLLLYICVVTSVLYVRALGQSAGVHRLSSMSWQTLPGV